ncbi:hypothetical protein [Sphingobacterium yanglingense]|uniref:Uncharacterized protein n=1 Tax=Sphingobacterium yanglingense TaxID=1437280 RepID=A0A4R6WHC8_9SPHI|nr:hypothetical protein [Sphingobacterium yanglingense]TDQ79583.1 hypothetical protein CLV99_1028 [Sphingobacterium yanglingense]
MIRKRAHKLRYIEVTPGQSFQDENGDWKTGPFTEKEVVLNCRADVNSGGRTIKNNDGQDFVYSFSIYLNKIPESLERGTFIEIILDNKVIGSGHAIMPWSYQTTNKIWV